MSEMLFSKALCIAFLIIHTVCRCAELHKHWIICIAEIERIKWLSPILRVKAQFRSRSNPIDIFSMHSEVKNLLSQFCHHVNQRP